MIPVDLDYHYQRQTDKSLFRLKSEKKDRREEWINYCIEENGAAIELPGNHYNSMPSRGTEESNRMRPDAMGAPFAKTWSSRRPTKMPTNKGIKLGCQDILFGPVWRE
jgi:hypothetical protein